MSQQNPKTEEQQRQEQQRRQEEQQRNQQGANDPKTDVHQPITGGQPSGGQKQ